MHAAFCNRHLFKRGAFLEGACIYNRHLSGYYEAVNAVADKRSTAVEHISAYRRERFGQFDCGERGVIATIERM